jgi:hypothetical protein
MYLVIPFTVTVDVDWQFAPLFIRNLETSLWRFYVLTANAGRIARVEAEKEAAGSGINPSSLVRLTIRGVALDFTPMTERDRILAAAPPPAAKPPGK